MKGVWMALCAAQLHGSWAEETLATLTLEEKIGQLFLVAAYVDDAFERAEAGGHWQEAVKEVGAGGIVFVGPSEVVRQMALSEEAQEAAKVPLLVAQDLEWGLSMRFAEAIRFPKNSALGFVDEALVYEMGREVAREARLIGVHMNLSPVLDVNTEQENVAINVRSFGSSAEEVAKRGAAMIRGLQDGGVAASAKHFPGLGDIAVDPHLGLPVSRTNELLPFTRAIEAGVLTIQTEHVLTQWDAAPASLSREVVTQLLKEKMGFSGLVISGALRMKALTNHFSDEEIALRAFRAGSDWLLMPRDAKRAFTAIREAVLQGEITVEEIEARVLKILRLKEWADCQRKPPRAETESLWQARKLQERLYRAALFVRDKAHLLPLAGGRLVEIGAGTGVLRGGLPEGEAIVLAIYPLDSRRIEKIRLMEKAEQETALAAFRVHGLTPDMLAAIEAAKRDKERTVVLYFGNVYGARFLEAFPTVIFAHEPEAEKVVLDLLLALKGNSESCLGTTDLLLNN